MHDCEMSAVVNPSLRLQVRPETEGGPRESWKEWDDRGSVVLCKGGKGWVDSHGIVPGDDDNFDSVVLHNSNRSR